MKVPVLSRANARQAFTLVEVMVSSVLVVLLMALLLQTVSQAQNLMSRTTAKVNQFKAARNAFEAMTRRLSQSTLNTYYRAFDQNPNDFKAAYSYTRESEMQFLSGPAASSDGGRSGILTSPEVPNLQNPPGLAYPTHSVFFQAPLGVTWELDTANSANGAKLEKFRQLDEAMVGLGYLVEFGPDPNVPSFLRELQYPKRERFRLVELLMPTERLSIYQRPLDRGSNEYNKDPQILNQANGPYVGMTDEQRNLTANWVRPHWLEDALTREKIPGSDSTGYRFKYGQVMAENVVALIVLPKVAPQDRKREDRIDDLAPDYRYDSWRILKVDPAKPFEAARDNQLPPILQVTMLVIDEPTAARVAERYGDQPPAWSEKLFERVTTPKSYLEDVDRLIEGLEKEPFPVSYRIFSKDIVLRGSKWSRDPFEGAAQEN